LNKKYVQKFIQSNHNIHIIEGNYQGQFADQLEKVSGEKFPHRLRKWDGRPFFVEDVVSYIDTYLEK
jgi:pyruvate/2-oxoacid:ferredoxin oxidoreductase alpha subunit